jgi:hypothetical protein
MTRSYFVHYQRDTDGPWSHEFVHSLVDVWRILRASLTGFCNVNGKHCLFKDALSGNVETEVRSQERNGDDA